MAVTPKLGGSIWQYACHGSHARWDRLWIGVRTCAFFALKFVASVVISVTRRAEYGMEGNRFQLRHGLECTASDWLLTARSLNWSVMNFFAHGNKLSNERQLLHMSCNEKSGNYKRPAASDSWLFCLKSKKTWSFPRSNSLKGRNEPKKKGEERRGALRVLAGKGRWKRSRNCLGKRWNGVVPAAAAAIFLKV